MYTVVPGCLPRLTSRALWFANGGRNRRLLRAYAAASAQQAPRSRSPPQRQRPPQQHDSSSGALKGAGATKRSFPSPLQQRRQAPARADYFYAESASSFEQLGITPAVAAALKAAGYARPSRVQVRLVYRWHDAHAYAQPHTFMARVFAHTNTHTPVCMHANIQGYPQYTHTC